MYQRVLTQVWNIFSSSIMPGLGSKGAQDNLTLYPISEEDHQENDDYNQLRLSDIDLEI